MSDLPKKEPYVVSRVLLEGNRLRACPGCKHTILYCDGVATPAIVWKHIDGSISTEHATATSRPLGCERCLFELSPAQKEKVKRKREKEERRAAQAAGASPAGRLEERPAVGLERREELSPAQHATQHVKKIAMEELGSVIEFVGEGLDLIDKAGSFLRKLSSKKP